MTEQLTVYEAGERFATISRTGRAVVYEVSASGRAVDVQLFDAHRHYETGPDGEYTCICGHPGKTRADWDRHHYDATKG
ncbi:hypothetical protein [Gordonia sp. (in: high G+C Gram-positive bacteria)]|uniref:hypothetical protein n=1 Tax=Gordonia sp. (in: high G+C Gram-positive bacteria) TaxID=84139 RepID=UPI0033408C47